MKYQGETYIPSRVHHGLDLPFTGLRGLHLNVSSDFVLQRKGDHSEFRLKAAAAAAAADISFSSISPGGSLIWLPQSKL